MGAAGIEAIVNLLTERYGERKHEPNDRPLDVLVETILSQNTSDLNSSRAFSSLKSAFPTFEAVEAARVNDLADSIRIGGLEAIKAQRIKQTLAEIRNKRGRLELDFLKELPLAEARDWLIKLPGVGAKTANCVLLFASGMPALPVDTHVFRVSKRLGLVDSKASVEKVHSQLEAIVPPEYVYQFHVLIIEHGRKVCKAQRPRCEECVLGRICPSNEVIVN
jgi:endonuclease-3